uniref:Uncharacterized protein n=1 Tax=Romanomermis culicivorax TaxID=13658 RepID=A0A915K8Q1_ROMCU
MSALSSCLFPSKFSLIRRCRLSVCEEESLLLPANVDRTDSKLRDDFMDCSFGCPINDEDGGSSTRPMPLAMFLIYNANKIVILHQFKVEKTAPLLAVRDVSVVVAVSVGDVVVFDDDVVVDDVVEVSSSSSSL